MFHPHIETLYVIILPCSKNGVWTSDEVCMPLYIYICLAGFGQWSHWSQIVIVVIATGHSFAIRAASPVPVNREWKRNQNCIDVFVSRPEPKTTQRSIQKHLQLETGFLVHPEKLATRYKEYASFFIRGDKKVRDTLRLMDPNLWPARTLLKPFFDWDGYSYSLCLNVLLFFCNSLLIVLLQKW